MVASMKTLPPTLPMTDPAADSLDDLAEAAKTLGHPHRLALLQAVLQRESTVEQLALGSGLSVTNASQHLQQLKRAGFIQSRRDGKHVLYPPLYRSTSIQICIGRGFQSQNHRMASVIRRTKQRADQMCIRDRPHCIWYVCRFS